MSQYFFPPEWLQKLADPYAVLGISVAADDRRILKRYRQLAKVLHPDRYKSDSSEDKELATQLFARLVNPAYKQLEQPQSRKEALSALRMNARSLDFDAATTIQSAAARELMKIVVKQAADVFYEQAIATLAESQYQPLANFDQLTQQLAELNLVYLRVEKEKMPVREKPTGLIAAVEAKPIHYKDIEAPAKNYADSHYQRAVEYAKQSNWAQAVQELRDALKLEANRSDYHALLGYVYLKQNLAGMSSAHIRQALKINPEQRLALKCADKLNMRLDSPKKSQQTAKTSGFDRLFSFWGGKKRSSDRVLESR